MTSSPEPPARWSPAPVPMIVSLPATAVDRDAEHRAFDVGLAEQRARVDEVVAGAWKGLARGKRKKSSAVPTWSNSLAPSTRLSLRLVRLIGPAVPEAVLRGVAVDHQRRVGPPRGARRLAGTRDGVAADGAAARRDGRLPPPWTSGERAVPRRAGRSCCRWRRLVGRASVPVMVRRSLPWPSIKFSTSIVDLPVAASPKVMPPRNTAGSPKRIASADAAERGPAPGRSPVRPVALSVPTLSSWRSRRRCSACRSGRARRAAARSANSGALSSAGSSTASTSARSPSVPPIDLERAAELGQQVLLRREDLLGGGSMAGRRIEGPGWPSRSRSAGGTSSRW